MGQAKNLIEAINRMVAEYMTTTGTAARTLTLSCGLYRRLIELRSRHPGLGSLTIGCTAVSELVTPSGRLAVVIDERMADAEIGLA